MYEGQGKLCGHSLRKAITYHVFTDVPQHFLTIQEMLADNDSAQYSPHMEMMPEGLLILMCYNEKFIINMLLEQMTQTV